MTNKSLNKVVLNIFLFVMALLPASIHAEIAVLDMTMKSGDPETSGDYSRQLYSATYMCDIAGYPYIVTSDLKQAMENDVILISGVIQSSSFSTDEYDGLLKWVEQGGRLLSPAIRSVNTDSSPYLSQLFGIDASQKVNRFNDRKLIIWNEEFLSDPELVYFDEPEEIETSVGTIKTFSMTPDGSDVLAHYNNGDAAVVRNRIGNGCSYLVSLSWRDVVQRNQLNKDQNSSRQYNNGFEPSSDIWALFLRSIHGSIPGVNVWKFTVPAGYTQLLIPTHDCDSRTAYDEMHHMADYEKSIGLKGHYFLTTHYYSDKEVFGHSYLSDFYNETTIPLAEQLIKDGHTVGSHSICHFPDFNKTDNTDIVTREEYSQRATCEDGVSRGASTWAEIVLSKQILENDLGNNVRSFRSGHLCVNKDFHAMLKEGEYAFQSCYTGGDLLSEFPFFGRYGNDWGGDQSETLTIPLHISDVYNNKGGEPLNNDTWETHPAVDEWESAMRKLRGNYASAILLVHPNRDWKMILQKRLTERLDPEETGVYNFEDYGDFWLSRLNCEYKYNFDKDTGVLTITTDIPALEKDLQTFAFETQGPYEVKSVTILSPEGDASVAAGIKKLSENRWLVIPEFEKGPGSVGHVSSPGKRCQEIYDLKGNLVKMNQDSDALNIQKLPKGIYVLKESGRVRKVIN